MSAGTEAVRGEGLVLRAADLEWAVSRLPEKLAWALRTFGPRAFVAGGHIRGCVAGEERGDVDVFVKDATTGRELIACLFDGEPFVSDFAATVILGGVPVQVIHRWHFQAPPDVLAHFDFSVCQAALWFDGGWRGACGEDFYPDLAARRITHKRTGERDGVETGGTLLRLMKYTARGYRASPETVAQIVIAATVQARTVETLIENLRGVDPIALPAWLHNDALTPNSEGTTS